MIFLSIFKNFYLINKIDFSSEKITGKAKKHYSSLTAPLAINKTTDGTILGCRAIIYSKNTVCLRRYLVPYTAVYDGII